MNDKEELSDEEKYPDVYVGVDWPYPEEFFFSNRVKKKSRVLPMYEMNSKQMLTIAWHSGSCDTIYCPIIAVNAEENDDAHVEMKERTNLKRKKKSTKSRAVKKLKL